MKPSFLLWMRQIGYFPYFFLADISIASIAVTATLYLWGTIDIFGLLGAYATLVLVEYVTAYLIYRIKNPAPTGIYFLGSDDPFMFSQEDYVETLEPQEYDPNLLLNFVQFLI